MALSSDLIAQFVKVTNDDTTTAKKETTIYGTVTKVNADGSALVQLANSEEGIFTPVQTTVSVTEGSEVIVMIKNHIATITGSTTHKAGSQAGVDKAEYDASVAKATSEDTKARIVVVEAAILERVTTKTLNSELANIDKLKADKADITRLDTDYAEVNKKLTAAEADIDILQADVAKIGDVSAERIEAVEADIHDLDATFGEFKQLSTNKFDAVEADISDLETKKLSAEEAQLTYVNIDFSNIDQAWMEQFYANSGLIKYVTADDVTVTGHLVGVTVSADLIEGNIIKADAFVLKGEDGLYYRLNTDGVTVEAEQTEYNSIDGSVIQAKSITASKINVSDLVAFDATIGGFHITDSSLYSEVKDSENNVTRGVYLDSDGQVNFGDESNFIKYYQDTDGSYKLVISASSILYSMEDKQYSIADLGAIGDYIHIGTYESEPCIELGDTHSDFKLIITNTRIMFMEGSSVPAYINNQSLHITKAVIEEEIQQGEFVWKVRANGNMGLMWKGEA